MRKTTATMVNADVALVQTTSWAASWGAQPISSAMMALETAVGVANRAIMAAYSGAAHCSRPLPASQTAAPNDRAGAVTFLRRMPVVISFHSPRTAVNSNCPPRTISAKGDGKTRQKAQHPVGGELPQKHPQ